MQHRDRPVWRVQSGGVTRWFREEHAARQYAKDRFDIDLDGVPFLDEQTDRELIARLNVLEASK